MRAFIALPHLELMLELAQPRLETGDVPHQPLQVAVRRQIARMEDRRESAETSIAQLQLGPTTRGGEYAKALALDELLEPVAQGALQRIV